MTEFSANERDEDISDLRKLQLVELQILKEFIRICESHQLKYYAIGGTALGAARHKGFIPWDDDIDVSMPRKDYNKFLEIASIDIDPRYEIRTINNKSYLHPITKIADKNVTTIMSKAYVETVQPVWIDVFPIDGLPNSKMARFFHVYLFLIHRKLFLISAFKECVEQYAKRPFYKRLIIRFCHKYNIQQFFNKKNRILAGDRLLAKYDFYKTKYCSPQLWGQYKTKAIFPTDWMGEGIRLPFEDIEIVVPANYNGYLVQLYGSDYMELPPVEKRSTHSSKIIFESEAVRL